jgi:trans-2,3-dihydro-3-hydroxyanthranilate isomerase
MRYLIVDVFSRGPFSGNALAVFPDAPDVPTDRMQAIARELNLSETTFVRRATGDSYEVSIFTPGAELPFAGHPTVGTSWALRHLGVLTSSAVTQISPAGRTPVVVTDEGASFERTGSVDEDAEVAPIAVALGVAPERIGFDAAAFGAPAARLMPAMADAGIPQLIVPLRDVADVVALQVTPAMRTLPGTGAYCIAPDGPGRAKARFFAPGVGIAEDPATGSAAAALALYLGARAGAVDLELSQGEEIGRPSTLHISATPRTARVRGRVDLVSECTLLV